MKAQIISVNPNYVEGPPDHDHPGFMPPKIIGTWSVDLVMVEGDDLTYEQACEYLRDQTKFALIPIVDPTDSPPIEE